MNEEAGIKQVIEATRLAGFSNIVVIDGHSTDNTVKIVKEENIREDYIEEGL